MRIKWTEELVKEKVYESMKSLGIDRMPSRVEMESVMGDSALTNRICKTGGFYQLADKLGLEIKDSETKTGDTNEKECIKLIQSNGWNTERMSVKCPFDILVDENIRVDVKSANPHYANGYLTHTFGINKPQPTCDIYILFALDNLGGIERVFVVPSKYIKMCSSMSIGQNSKYNMFIDKWDYFNKCHDYYESM